MENKKLIYFALGSVLMLSSCAQDDPAPERPGDNNRIYFRSNLPSVTQSRAGIVTIENFSSCQVTCFNTEESEFIESSTGKIAPYFNDICFEKDADGLFFSKGEDDCMWPATKNTLHFFAYYPSATSMKQTIDKDNFNLVNTSHLSNTAVLDYRLEKFRVAPDIANQIDFLTEYTTASQMDNVSSGIELNFKHQLARVELSAWGANEKYSFEIAGVRIGNALTQADFKFHSSNGEYPWLISAESQSAVEHIFSPRETIVYLDKETASHATENDAASIMGSAGPAMLIPMQTRIEAWEGKADPEINSESYSTDKMYFSVLLRVKNRNNEVVYPYPNDRDNMTVIYFAVDNKGRIKERLTQYKGTYYSSDGLIYVPDDSDEICGFGWASLPVAARWEAGKIYTYKLNYSGGIGWHDPSDPTPGEPIIERGKIPFEVSVADWALADDYNSELNVPKR